MENVNKIDIVKMFNKRAKIVNYIYKFELFSKKLDSINAFESGDFSDNEIKKIDNIVKNYDKFKKNIVKNMSETWKWERLGPYIRAILIYGSFELLMHDKNLVVNEMVNLTKVYAPDDSYKFINGILDKVGKYYEKIKNC